MDDTRTPWFRDPTSTETYGSNTYEYVDPDAGKYRKPNRHERRRLESLTAQWNKNKHKGKLLHAVLGMSLTEYARYVETGEVPLTF